MRLKLKTGKSADFYRKKEERKKRKSRAEAGRRKSLEYQIRQLTKAARGDVDSATIHETLKRKKFTWGKKRKKFFREYFKTRKYDDQPKVLAIYDELGIESNLDKFLVEAQKLFNANSRSFYFDLENCSRLWPSGVILICSLKQWCEITSQDIGIPRISASLAGEENVENYLRHCGFDDYVNRPSQEMLTKESGEVFNTVKIHKETSPENSEERHDEITNLVRLHSGFTEMEVEIFNDRIVSEILNNVHEHGINNQDYGWYTISQVHKRTGIISICIADNGMGIENSLLTGPQSEDIRQLAGNTKHKDSWFIKKAFEPNISGAFSASVGKAKVLKGVKYARGSRRGHGLKRIKDSCARLNIPLTILSNNECLRYDQKGSIQKSVTLAERVFAGTLYQLEVPIRKT